MIDIYEAKQKRNTLLVKIDKAEGELKEMRKQANELTEAIMDAEEKINISKYGSIH